jgi:cytochrome c-type biogenesis protein CcmE
MRGSVGDSGAWAHTRPMPDGDAPQPSLPDTQARAASSKEEASQPEGTKPWILGLVLLGLSGMVGWLLLGGGDPFVYSQTVTDVVSDPGRFEGRELRVEGSLTDGSVRFRDDPCEWRFTLQDGEGESARLMPVEFHQCIVPDTFRDHMDITVVVQGEIQEGGTFIASQVIPRCPSRYDMDERAGRGEEMPHAAPIRETPPPPES